MLINDFFNKLTEQNINYCIWKSSINLKKIVEGNDDIDLLIDIKDLNKLEIIINELNIKRFISDINYNGIYDYIGYDQVNMRLIHFHVHFKILLGKDYIKDYYIPNLEQHILMTKKSYYINNMKIYIINEYIEFIIFIMRLAMKYNGIYLIKYKFKIKIDDIQEFNYLIKQIKNINDIEYYFKKINLNKKIFKIVNSIYKKKVLILIDLLKINKELKLFQRFGIIEKNMLLIKNIIFIKYISYNREYGKKIPSGGKCISFIGIDGSGKSTIVKELDKFLTPLIKHKIVYLGSNTIFSKFFWYLIGWLYIPYKILPKNRIFIFFKDIVLLIMEYIYLIEKTYKIRKIHKLSTLGYIILSDRYPIYNYSDTPFNTWRCEICNKYKIFKKIKNFVKEKYKLFFLPDNIILLNISIEEALERKNDHSIELLKNKYKLLHKYKTINKNLFIVNSSNNILDTLNKIIYFIWNRL